jgi:short-subunit dehydrogenase
VAEGSVVIVGGTRGIGREIAALFAGRGREVVLTGRDEATAEQVATEIGGGARGLALDLSHPKEIAGRLADVGPVEHLVLVAIDRDSNTAGDYDIERALALVTLKLVGYTEAIHALVRGWARTPRSSCSAGWRRIARIPARRPSARSTAA